MTILSAHDYHETYLGCHNQRSAKIHLPYNYLARHKSLLITRDPGNFIPCPPNPNGQSNNYFEEKGWDQYIQNPAAFAILRDHQHPQARRKIQQNPHIINVNLPAVQGHSDLIYMADGSFSLLDEKGVLRTVFSNFANPNRHGEEQHHRNYFNSAAFKRMGCAKKHITATAPFPFEGNGDCLYDPYRGVIWSGYHQNPGAHTAHEGRGDIRANRWLEAFFGIPVIDIENQFPFYHIDTAMAPLSHGHIVVYPGGMTDESLQRLKHEAFEQYSLNPAEYLIEASEDDANKFACNIVEVNGIIHMPNCSDQLQTTLRSKGYQVTTLDVTTLIAGGGATHCIENIVNRLHLEGGTHTRPEFMPLPH